MITICCDSFQRKCEKFVRKRAKALVGISKFCCQLSFSFHFKVQTFQEKREKYESVKKNEGFRQLFSFSFSSSIHNCLFPFERAEEVEKKDIENENVFFKKVMTIITTHFSHSRRIKRTFLSRF